MAVIKKFNAIRPTESLAQKVAALPYDVMNKKEAMEMVENNPYSFLHVDRSEIDLPDEIDPHDSIVYEKAMSNLQKMIADNILIKDENPCLYIYQLISSATTQTGLVACTSVNEYINGTIKKHELTRKDKEQDRINHIKYCNANTGPIFLTYKDDIEITSIITKWVETNSPIYDFLADDNVTHKVWKIDINETSDSIIKLFQEVPYLYIADGHHRNASAAEVALMKRKENPNYQGDEEFNYYLSVLFPASQLKIMDYNRVVKDLNGLTIDEFIESISKNFYILPFSGVGGGSPKSPHQFGMFIDERWYILHYDPEKIPIDPVKSLDVSLLQDLILSPILGIDDPRTNERIDFVGGIRGLEELEKRVLSGNAKVAFSMYPTSITQLMDVADSGDIMPPKSTWFEPKLRSGLFLHELD